MNRSSFYQVLLVEDEASDASLIRQYLKASRNQHFEITWKKSLAGACVQLQEHSFDILLLDLSLPDSDGLATVRKMRDLVGVLPIIVLTGHDDTDFALEVLASGAQDYLVKGSFDTESLVRAIRYAMSRAGLEKRLHDSEQRMAMALSVADLGLWDWHIPSGKVIHSDLWLDMLGYSKEEIEPHIDSWKKLVYADDLAVVNTALERHLNGETAVYKSEHRLMHKDGRWLWVHDIGRVLEWDSRGKPIRAVGLHQNISERKIAEERNHLLVSALEAVDHGVMITNIDAKIEWVNKAFETLTGYSFAEAVGKRPAELVKSGIQDQLFYQSLWKVILSDTTWRGELINRRKNGELYHEELVIAPVKDQDNIIRHFVGIKQDISKRKHMEQELWQLATTDSLTGFLNRRHFLVRLDDELTRVKRNEHGSVAVLMLDLDHFKRINDRYGHALGDAALRHFAGIIRTQLRQADVVGRLGGEEFAVFLPDSDLFAAKVFAERLCQRVAGTPLAIYEHTIQVTVSIGIALMDQASISTDLVFANADLALYAAKSAGRNRAEIWENPE